MSFCVCQEGAGTERFCLREDIAVPAAEEHHPEFAGTFLVTVRMVSGDSNAATALFRRLDCFVSPTEGLTSYTETSLLVLNEADTTGGHPSLILVVQHSLCFIYKCALAQLSTASVR